MSRRGGVNGQRMVEEGMNREQSWIDEFKVKADGTSLLMEA